MLVSAEPELPSEDGTLSQFTSPNLSFWAQRTIGPIRSIGGLLSHSTGESQLSFLSTKCKINLSLGGEHLRSELLLPVDFQEAGKLCGAYSTSSKCLPRATRQSQNPWAPLCYDGKLATPRVLTASPWSFSLTRDKRTLQVCFQSVSMTFSLISRI